LVSGVRGVFVVASGLPSPVTDARELAHQNHWGSVSSASPSPYAGIDPLCARTTPTRAEGRRPLRLFVCQATNGCGEMSVRLVFTKTQQGSNKPFKRHAVNPLNIAFDGQEIKKVRDPLTRNRKAIGAFHVGLAGEHLIDIRSH